MKMRAFTAVENRIVPSPFIPIPLIILEQNFEKKEGE
jgi:hypothetical protein